MQLTLESTVRLSSGGQLPRLGYGVYQARGQECTDGVAQALRAGYRHIDSAQGYRNEDLVAKGVEAASIPRSDLFLTTKYMPTHKVHSADAVYKYLRSSLEKLDPGERGYIDLMLIHAAWGGQEGRANNWAALARAQKEGWIKDIGVSNFGVQHLKDLPGPTPAVNQIELHPWCQQRDIVSYCNQHGIIVEAYSPLVRADKDRLAEPVVVEISNKHNKQATQVLVRWSLQKGFVPLPKSVQLDRIKANADVFDFELDEEDMKKLDGLDRGKAGAVTWNPVDTE